MANEKYSANKADIFNDQPEDAAAPIYGEVPIPDSGRIIARPIPLDQITPDPRQPRRAIPTRIRQIEPAAPPMTLLKLWHKDVIQTTQLRQLEPAAFIMGKETDLPDVHDESTRQLLKLYALAGSIFKDGLLNPITIAPDGDKYILETGERRYLAYNLLAVHADFNRFNKIPARIMDTHDIWRQAHENNNRDDLNPIQKARQLALLLISMWEGEREFIPYTDADSDREFYAQAYDLNSRRGEGQRLMDAMGVSNRASITMYKRLLLLNDDEWESGETENRSLNELLKAIDEREGTNYGVQNKPYVYSSKHNSENTALNNPPSPPPSFAVGDYARHPNSGYEGKIIRVTKKLIMLTDTDKDASVEDIHANFVPASVTTETSRYGFSRGSRVRMGDKFGTVQAILSGGKELKIQWDDGGISHNLNDALVDDTGDKQPDLLPHEVPSPSPAIGSGNTTPFNNPYRYQSQAPITDDKNPFTMGQSITTPDGRGSVVGISGSNVTVQLESNRGIIAYAWRDLIDKSAPPFNDTDARKVPLEPSDTIIPGGRSGINVPIGTQPNINPTQSGAGITNEQHPTAIKFNRFDRVRWQGEQGVITQKSVTNTYTVNIFEGEDGRRITNRTINAADLTPLPDPQIGDYAIDAETGAMGIIQHIDRDGSGITLKLESGRTLTVSAIGIHILYDYDPTEIEAVVGTQHAVSPSEPENNLPPRVDTMFDAFSIILNECEAAADQQFALEMMYLLTDEAAADLTDEDYTRFVEIFEREISASITAVMDFAESVRNHHLGGSQ